MVGQIQAATDLKAQWQALLGATPAKQSASSTPCVIRQATAPTSSQSQDAASGTLLQFERARVSYQETRTVEPGRSYSVSATLAYERIAFSQLSSDASGVPQTPAPPIGSTDTPDDASNTPVSTTPLHHVVVNAMSLSYQRLSVHVTAAPHAAAKPATTTPALDTDTAPSTSSDQPAIEQLDSADFSAMRARTVERSRETSLTLKLTTQEGDLVELVFQQLDLSSRTRVSGVTDSGDRIRASDTTGSSQRYVNMQITGDLSDAEKSAIDAVLQKVVEVANQFFHGDMQAAIARLSDAQIDTDQLAEFSLKMSMSRSREMNKLVSGDDGQLQQFAHHDSGVSQTLEFLADQQHQLIAAAMTRFDDRSAVTLVKQLLPVMIAPPSAPDEAASADADGSAVTA